MCNEIIDVLGGGGEALRLLLVMYRETTMATYDTDAVHGNVPGRNKTRAP